MDNAPTPVTPLASHRDVAVWIQRQSDVGEADEAWKEAANELMSAVEMSLASDSSSDRTRLDVAAARWLLAKARYEQLARRSTAEDEGLESLD